jgi:hypothetical protein
MATDHSQATIIDHVPSLLSPGIYRDVLKWSLDKSERRKNVLCQQIRRSLRTSTPPTATRSAKNKNKNIAQKRTAVITMRNIS